MLLKLSRTLDLLTKESMMLRAPGAARSVGRLRSAGHQLGKAEQILKSEAMLADDAARMARPSVKPNMGSLQQAASKQELPNALHMKDMPLPASSHADDVLGGHVLEMPGDPAPMGELIDARTPAGALRPSAPAGAGTNVGKPPVQVPAHTPPVQQASAPVQEVAQQVVEQAPRQVPQQPANLESVPPSFRKHLLYATGGTSLGMGGAMGAHAVAQPDAQKAASLVDQGLEGAFGLGKLLLGSRAGRAALGTTALVGGLGAYGAAQGVDAQHPDAPNPLSAPTPYGKMMRYAYEEVT